MKYLHLLIFLASCTTVSVCSQPSIGEPGNPPWPPGIHVVTLGVSDLTTSFQFYRDGLGFPTKMTPDGGIVLFTTSGAKLFLYTYANLAKTSGVELEEVSTKEPVFSGFTLAHGVPTKEDVDLVLQRAEKAGGKITKPAHEVSWGAYVGYFSDPDGYLWEVAYSDLWYFSPEGVLIFRE